MRTSDVDAMRAAGIDPATIARALELSPIKKRIKLRDGVCPACGSAAMPGDFVCGTCSELYAGQPRRFWQFVYNRFDGKVGRAIYPKPGPQRLPAQTPKPVVHKIVPVSAVDAPERAPEFFEFLVTVGLMGRVVVAQSPAQAARIAHVVNGDGPTAGHAVLCLGRTTEPETEADAPKIEKKKDVGVEHTFRIDGPGYTRELKLATVAGTDRV